MVWVGIIQAHKNCSIRELDMSISVGIIGLGPMGGNVAANLLDKGFNVMGCDILPERVTSLADKGLVGKPSIAELAADADVLVTSLPNGKALNAVIAELENSNVDASKRMILMECSTLTLDDKLAAHAALEKIGINMLDCPISATPPMLAKGMASIHISGDESAYKTCLPVFEGFTASNFYVGEVGNGTKMKLLANYLVHVHVTAAAECMVFGQQAGLDPELIYSVLKESAGTSKMFEIRGAMMAKSDYREGGGTMFDVYVKDASIINEYAASVHAPIDLYASSRQKMNSALALGLGHLDTSAVCKAIEHAAGIDRKLVE